MDSRVLFNHILNWIFPEDAQISACGTPGYLRAKSAAPCFVSKILMGYSLTHSFMYYLWLLSCYNGRAE